MSTREILLKADSVGKRFGGFVALQGIDLELRVGERLGLIGPNGSGKSTFVNCISGDFAAHDGQVTLAGKSLAGLKRSGSHATGNCKTQNRRASPAISSPNAASMLAFYFVLRAQTAKRTSSPMRTVPSVTGTRFMPKITPSGVSR